jgi:hypothetical protein
LASNGTYTSEVSYTFGATARKMRIVGIVDSDKAVAEVSRDNNQIFIRSSVDQSTGTIIAVLTEEEKKNYAKAIIDVLEKLKTPESINNIDDDMVA